ncbi:hypothetical protein UC8_58480 [Roseimaritima ulvae]|uniref:DUF2071 domain-containing protein n=2 Tax=Roseimaritima ulvae TaxID=980254 RepID=A0A5B9R091_9BACT|nr:hypothetical protein UC8_58480 [Roseimaritima ulvae]
MAQRWSNLLFAHWPVPLELLRSEIPDVLEIDTFEGEAWIGIVPFELRIRPRLLPVVPAIAAFPEINVRTYVTHQGRPGVWFFSLDATSPLAVRLARWAFHLPYFDARMAANTEGQTMAFRSERRKAAVATRFFAAYRPVSDVFLASTGSLDAWLTERYCLYAADGKGRVARTEVHHQPWPLQKAACEIEQNSMTAPLGFELSGEPLLHYSKRIDVVNWLPQRLAAAP